MQRKWLQHERCRKMIKNAWEGISQGNDDNSVKIRKIYVTIKTLNEFERT